MNLKDFKAGVLQKQFQYRSFTPTLINHSWVWDEPKINTRLEQATRALAARSKAPSPVAAEVTRLTSPKKSVVIRAPPYVGCYLLNSALGELNAFLT